MVLNKIVNIVFTRYSRRNKWKMCIKIARPRRKKKKWTLIRFEMVEKDLAFNACRSIERLVDTQRIDKIIIIIIIVGKLVLSIYLDPRLHSVHRSGLRLMNDDTTRNDVLFVIEDGNTLVKSDCFFYENTRC